MADRCPDCERPMWTEAADDLVSVCFCQGDANCELACRLRASDAALGNLLARCLRDGGQRQLAVGTEQALVEADAVVARAFASEAECERLRREVEDLRHLFKCRAVLRTVL